MTPSSRRSRYPPFPGPPWRHVTPTPGVASGERALTGCVPRQHSRVPGPVARLGERQAVSPRTRPPGPRGPFRGSTPHSGFLRHPSPHPASRLTCRFHSVHNGTAGYTLQPERTSHHSFRWVRRSDEMPATLIVANLRSGGGRARDTLPLVTSALRRAGREFDQVAVVGGDGTINGAVNGLVVSGTALPLGIVPCGTGNEIMRSLGLPKHPEKAVDILLRGRTCPVDVGVVNGRYFLNTFGLGADVEVVKLVNTLRSRYRFARNRSVYYLAALLLLSSGFDPFPVEVQVKERVFRGRAIMIVAANGRIYGERLLALPSPSLTDGLLDLYLLEELGSRKLRKTARLLRRLPVPELSVQRCSEVVIRLNQRREAHVDGSLFGPAQTFTLSLLPQRITVMHPAPPALAGVARELVASGRGGMATRA